MRPGYEEGMEEQEETIRRPDGSQTAVLVNAIPLGTREQWASLGQEGETSEETSEPVALVVHQDVSSLKEAEYLKDEFIALAAHELRNPLGALKGFADTLLYQTARQRGPELTPWQRESLQEIEQASTRLEKLTGDLLDVTRVQAGRLQLTRKPTDLLEVSRHLLAQARMSTQRHSFSLQTTLSPIAIPICVQSSRKWHGRFLIRKATTFLLSIIVSRGAWGRKEPLSLLPTRAWSLFTMS